MSLLADIEEVPEEVEALEAALIQLQEGANNGAWEPIEAKQAENRLTARLIHAKHGIAVGQIVAGMNGGAFVGPFMIESIEIRSTYSCLNGGKPWLRGYYQNNPKEVRETIYNYANYNWEAELPCAKVTSAR